MGISVCPRDVESELTDAEYARRLEELDRLLNDPDVPMEAAKIWYLLAEIAQRNQGSARGAARLPGVLSSTRSQAHLRGLQGALL